MTLALQFQHGEVDRIRTPKLNEMRLAVDASTAITSDATIIALAALDATAGIVVETAADTFTKRTLTGTANRLTITNGDGVAGAPTFDISAAYVGQASITTLGTIATGTWQGTTVGVGYGGTGLASYAVGDLIYASGAATLAKLADVATGNALISGGVTTAPSWGKIGLTTHVAAITASRALVSDGSGFVSAATTTATEIGYVNGVTSAIQTQINGKQATITFGTGVQTALGINIGSAGAFVTFNGALGTPSSGTATNITGLPISTGVSGLGTGVATFLATPSSANLAAALTDETGAGAAVFANTPTLVTPEIGAATSAVTAGGISLKATQSTGSVANNATYDFPTAQTYGFFFIAEATATGATALCASNGATVVIMSQSSPGFYTPTSGTGGAVNLFYSGGVIRIQNKFGSTTSFRIMNLVAGA